MSAFYSLATVICHGWSWINRGEEFQSKGAESLWLAKKEMVGSGIPNVVGTRSNSLIFFQEDRHKEAGNSIGTRQFTLPPFAQPSSPTPALVPPPHKKTKEIMSLVPAPPPKKSKLCQQLSEHKTLDCLLSFALSFHTMTKNCLPPSFLSLSQQSVIKDNCVNLKNQEHFDMSLTFSLCDDQSDRIPNHRGNNCKMQK